VAGQGRHDAQTVDASALGADEGRGNAAIRRGEPLAGCDPRISEWGNPITSVMTGLMAGGNLGN